MRGSANRLRHLTNVARRLLKHAFNIIVWQGKNTTRSRMSSDSCKSLIQTRRTRFPWRPRWTVCSPKNHVVIRYIRTVHLKRRLSRRNIATHFEKVISTSQTRSFFTIGFVYSLSLAWSDSGLTSVYSHRSRHIIVSFPNISATVSNMHR
jgi:hypothetical protein